MPAMVLVERRDAHQSVHSMLRSKEPIRSRASHDEGRALEPGLLTRRGVEDLGFKVLSLGPFEIHAHQHLDPVLRLDAALPYRDGDHGVVVGVWIRKEQVELAGSQLFGDRRALLSQLLFELGVAVGKLVQLDQVAGPLLEAVPGGDQLAEFGSLTRHLPGTGRVVPNAWLHHLSLELCSTRRLRWKVKGAPSAARSVPEAL